MKVSVVMPAWKRRFLRQAVQSVLAQTHRNFELVVVDDASPERLDEIVGEFNDPRLSYRRNPANIGGRDLAAAWNLAMECADGECSVLASDDDIYAPDYLSEMVRLADSRPDVDLFHCRLAFIDAEGKDCGMSEERAPHETGAEFVYNRAARRMKQCAPEFMFRTEAFRRIGGFVSFPRAWYSDDATWMLLARDNGVEYSPRPLLSWRSSGENISTRHDDVVEKIAAADAYRRWMREFLSGLRPSNPSDAALVELTSRELDYAIDHLSLWTLRNAGFVSAIRATFRAEEGSAAFLLRMLRTAVARLARTHERRLVPLPVTGREDSGLSA